MAKKLSEILPDTVYLFKTAKRLRKKYGEYAITSLEDAAIESMCGTGNANMYDYIDCFYKGVITMEELLENLAHPLKKDAAEGHYDE